jgi:hypothetical protein
VYIAKEKEKGRKVANGQLFASIIIAL